VRELVASYAFLPWLRTGVGAEITRVDGTGPAERRHSLPIAIRFNDDDSKKGDLTLELFGPGEVRAFDARAVIRTWPRPGVMDAEPNYFPIIEFDQADLPWRYTPARATNASRLTPWMTLIVLADDEIDGTAPPQGAELGLVSIKDAAVLPKHDQLWAWAHVQVVGETSVTEARVAELLATHPERVIARFVAPRRMQPRQAYTAFLVPTFQRGVLSGMGQDPADSVDGLDPAWTNASNGSLTLPVYYQWRFGTSVAGDFESLARLIKKWATPPTIGVRDMDVSAPSPGAPPAHGAALGMLGMLRGTTTPETSWPDRNDATDIGWIAWLKKLLNRPVDRLQTQNEPRTVTPPLYGQWHAAMDRCTADDPNPRPSWFQSLNVDPRLRVAAGLGTQVIQNNQEALMASAWEQVERIRKLNEELRQAQLAREMAARIMDRHIMVPRADAVLSLTAPVLARIKASPRTIRAVLGDSPVPRGMLEGAFRRIARPLGPLGRRQGRAEQPAGQGIIARVNRGELSAAPPPPTPSDVATPSRAGTGLAPGVSTTDAAARQRRSRWMRIVAIVLFVIAIVLFVVGLAAIAAVIAGFAVALFGAAIASARAADDVALQVALRDGHLTGDALRAVSPPASYVPHEAPPGGVPRTLPAQNGGPAAPVAVINAVRESIAKVYDRVAPPSAPAPVLQPVNLGALQMTIRQAIDPRRTISGIYKGRFTLKDVQWEPDDPIEPIMAAPEFPQALYAELKKISVEWLLPGFSQIPPNIATLLLASGKMVETFMVGANHEMSRELLWREYPTDQRGTYFRQFWDAAGFVPEPGQTVDPETLKDITPVHTWPKPSTLGQHSPRPLAPGQDYLVLLVRGDLLRRYPNTLVYAARAKWAAGGLREIDDPAPNASDAEIAAIQEWPLFSGLLEPDGTFFGFKLTVPQVKGSADPSGDPGWFFVLQEHSHEPRFGLDEADVTQLGVTVSGSDWNNLSWGSLVADQDSLDHLLSIDLDADLPDTSLVTDVVSRLWHADQGRGQHGSRASDLAYITFQRPMRVGIHGADMIP